jgi:hypothetical protein
MTGLLEIVEGVKDFKLRKLSQMIGETALVFGSRISPFGSKVEVYESSPIPNDWSFIYIVSDELGFNSPEDFIVTDKEGKEYFHSVVEGDKNQIINYVSGDWEGKLGDLYNKYLFG